MAARKRASARKYGKAASKSVERALHKEKRGTLKGGAGKHPKVKSREQAIAIGLSEARAAGAKVPSKAGAKKSASKKTTAKKIGARKTIGAKKPTRKSAR